MGVGVACSEVLLTYRWGAASKNVVVKSLGAARAAARAAARSAASLRAALSATAAAMGSSAACFTSSPRRWPHALHLC